MLKRHPDHIFFPSKDAFSRKISGSAFQSGGRGVRAALFIS
jgi:hypothetical protein